MTGDRSGAGRVAQPPDAGLRGAERAHQASICQVFESPKRNEPSPGKNKDFRPDSFEQGLSRSKRPLQRRVINSPQSFLPDFYFFPLIIRVFHDFSFLHSLPPRGTGSRSNQGHIQEQNIKGSILVPHPRENIGEPGKMKQITHPNGRLRIDHSPASAATFAAESGALRKALKRFYS